MFGNFVSKLNAGAKEFVGISLNASGLLEVSQINRVDREVVKYTNRIVNYNAITREVEDYDTLREEIASALEELKIPAKGSNVTFSMPNVLFGIVELPDMLDDSGITSALMSTVEESYLFKREDPVISWAKTGFVSGDGMQKIAYSAIQASALDEIQGTVFEKLGMNLISVQNQMSTLLEGLSFAQAQAGIEQVPWNLLLISANSYSLFNFMGDSLQYYYEEPLAVKSFTAEEVYGAVGTMASSVLQEYPALKLMVISDTDEVSAEIIAPQLGVGGDIVVFEQNKYQQAPPLEVSLDVLPNLKNQITLNSVGSAVDHYENHFVKFNYLSMKDGVSSVEAADLITIGNNTYEVTKEKVTKIAMLCVVVVAVIFGGVYGLVNAGTSSLNAKLSALDEEEAMLQKELKANNDQPASVNIGSTISAIVKSNRKKMLYYDSLSYGIPEKLWIESFYAGTGDAIAIKGVALNSNDITAFLKGIREVAGESEVSVSKLEITGGDDFLSSKQPEMFSFVLANQAYKSVESTVNSAEADSKTEEPKDVSNQQSQEIPPADQPSEAPPVIPSESN